MDTVPQENSVSWRRPLRVLLADESAMHRSLVSDILAQWGIAPAFARDGEQAVKIFQQWVFDIVLMEIVLPGMGGMAATVQIRQIELGNRSRPSVPVVAYTGLNMGSDMSTIWRIGFHDVLPKPCSPASLRACLERWCGDKFMVDASAARSSTAAQR